MSWVPIRKFTCYMSILQVIHGVYRIVVVVVVVVAVVGQTVGSISSKTLAYDCSQLTRTFGGFSAQCLSKLFLKEFTVLLLTTSLGRALKVVVILIG